MLSIVIGRGTGNWWSLLWASRMEAARPGSGGVNAIAGRPSRLNPPTFGTDARFHADVCTKMSEARAGVGGMDVPWCWTAFCAQGEKVCVISGKVMKENRRGNNRRPEALEMSVKSATGENRTYTTLNVSDNGIFLLATIPDQLPVGMEVTVIPTRFKGGPQEISIKGRVAHTEEHGMGIEFVDSKFN